VDFALGETQQAVIRAAGPVLDRGQLSDRRQPPDRRPPLAADGDDRALWKELGQAGLLELGGDGLGVLDTAVLLAEVGRRAAPVPALATLAMGALPVIRSVDRGLQRALLDGVAAGDTVLTAAVREPPDPMPRAPATTVTRAGTVSGVKIGVPYGAAARWSRSSSSAGPSCTCSAAVGTGPSWRSSTSSTGS
jgi:3-oxo-4-pregnene-20-carboxyl-CoA dehydrogenase alpha subunit